MPFWSAVDVLPNFALPHQFITYRKLLVNFHFIHILFLLCPHHSKNIINTNSTPTPGLSRVGAHITDSEESEIDEPPAKASPYVARISETTGVARLDRRSKLERQQGKAKRAAAGSGSKYGVHSSDEDDLEMASSASEDVDSRRTIHTAAEHRRMR